MIACSGVKNENDQSQLTDMMTPSQTYSIPKTPQGPRLFISKQFGLEVELPEGWAGIEGPEESIAHVLVGLVSFNSWGQPKFWVRQIVEHNPDGSIKSTHYGPEDVASQVPVGEAYVALIQVLGPLPDLNQERVEYDLNDLSGLVNIHDWRQDGGNKAFFKEFCKSGKTLRVEIFCSRTATDKTVEGLNHLLQSWRFG
jgi:hypothetical protein